MGELLLLVVTMVPMGVVGMPQQAVPGHDPNTGGYYQPYPPAIQRMKLKLLQMYQEHQKDPGNSGIVCFHITKKKIENLKRESYKEDEKELGETEEGPSFNIGMKWFNRMN